jgi:hypothetical protein
VARAWKKVLKVAALNQEMKDEVSAAVDGLIRMWKSLQTSRLRAEAEVADQTPASEAV